MFQKDCISCSTPFETENIRRSKCKPDCGRKRGSRPADNKRRGVSKKAERERHELEFIGVDGEGTNTFEFVPDWDLEGNEQMIRVPAHHYVLLSVGDQSLHKNGAPLNHDDVFRFLYDQFEKNPNAVFVGYFLGYDFTMWMKSLPARAAWELLTPMGQFKRENKTEGRPRYAVNDATEVRWTNGKPTHVGARWEFDMIGPKQLKLRPYVPRDRWPMCEVTHKTPDQIAECETGAHRKHPNAWMFINDTGSFFQTKFTNAIDPANWDAPIVSVEEFALISRGKDHRACNSTCRIGDQDNCSATLGDAMMRYNVLENEVLSRLMSRINEGFVEDNIRLSKRQWYGPGQAAQAWMKNIGVPKGEQIREFVPLWAREAARDTYYGGWFEIFSHGPIPGESYNYDINSAYPSIIAELPCLLHGKWVRGKSPKPRPLKNREIRMLYVTIEGDDTWVGPVQHRNPDGSICRPWKTRGWHWQHEIEAAHRAGLVKKMRIHEWITYTPCGCPPPMAEIRNLYEGRLRVNKNSPQGKGKKLVYNSSYGKLCQSIGKPQFSNPVWASLITAGCRTMILEAIASHPTKTNSLLMIATDGIVFKEPHPGLDLDKSRLGAWDHKVYHNLSLFMPGVYWHDKAREAIRAGRTPQLKSRGVSAKDLGKIIDKVDALWENIEPGKQAVWKWPSITMPIEFSIISGKLAITRGAWETCGRVSHDGVRDLSGEPTRKRWVPQSDSGFTIQKFDDLGWRTYPVPVDVPESTYYTRMFGDPELTFREPLQVNGDDDEGLDEGMYFTPEGDLTDVLPWAFQNED